MSSVRCSVKSLAALACPPGPTAVVWSGTDALLSNGSNLLFVFSTSEQTMKAIHRFPSPVTHLAQSPNKQGLYVLCEHDGIHFIPLQQHRRTGDGPGLEDAPPHSRVIADPGISSFAVLPGVLVTAVLREAAWCFCFYEVPEDPAMEHMRLAQRQLCGVSSGVAGTSGRPVLCPVFTCHSATAGRVEGSSALLLDPALFAFLFGVDASLVSSPAVICGLPDGRLCALPLLQQPGVRLRVFHSLGEPVLFVGNSVASVAEAGSGALVAVGQFGKVLVAQVRKKEGGAVPVFREHGVASPVAAACIDGTCLYYSTCSDLLGLPLGCTDQRQGQGLGLDPPQNPVSLNVCGIVALTKPRRNSAGSNTGATELLALSLTGRLLRVTLPEGSDGGCVQTMSPAQAALRTRDLLTAIGNVSERASSLKRSIQVRNKTLMKLNQVFNICCLLLPNQIGWDGHVMSKPPIRFRLATKWSSLLRQDSLTLSCVLENSSSYVLEHGWTCTLQVMPANSGPHLHGRMYTKTYSFPVEMLAPANNLEVTLPLALSNELLLPVKVSCSLAYALQSMLGTAEARHTFQKGTPLSELILDADVIVLPVDTITVDWLDCLRIGGPAVPQSSPTPASPAGLATSFLQAQRQKQLECDVRWPSPWGMGEGPFLSTIGVSSTLLMAGFQGLPFARLSLRGSLLEWLVCGCPGTQAGDALVDGTTVHGCWPSGETVTMTAKEVTIGDVSIDRPVVAVELRLESSSLAGLCGIRQAVLRRVQAFVKEVAKETDGPAHLQGQSLRCALEHAEALWEEVQEVCGQASLGAGTSPRMVEQLLQVYRRLREAALLIL